MQQVANDSAYSDQDSLSNNHLPCIRRSRMGLWVVLVRCLFGRMSSAVCPIACAGRPHGVLSPALCRMMHRSNRRCSASLGQPFPLFHDLTGSLGALVGFWACVTDELGLVEYSADCES